ncbi:MAG: hypothetical protein EPN91_00465 [Salinibacterium sp.]|nr:MAG: hypothetical protein EPN91_00465 [Salinibacterium sp.]
MTQPPLLRALNEWSDKIILDGWNRRVAAGGPDLPAKSVIQVNCGGGAGAVSFYAVQTLSGPDAAAASDDLYRAMNGRADIGNPHAAILTCACVTRSWREENSTAVLEWTGDASWRAA